MLVCTNRLNYSLPLQIFSICSVVCRHMSVGLRCVAYDVCRSADIQTPTTPSTTNNSWSAVYSIYYIKKNNSAGFSSRQHSMQYAPTVLVLGPTFKQSLKHSKKQYSDKVDGIAQLVEISRYWNIGMSSLK